MSEVKVKFASQAEPKLLHAVRAQAKQEGRQFQALVDEAFRDYLDKKQQAKPRKHVMKALVESMREYDGLYQNFARMLESAEQIMEEDKDVLKKLSES